MGDEKGGKKSRRGLWIFLSIIIILILILVILFFTFARPFSSAEIDRGIPDKGVDVLSLPLAVDADESFDIEYRVMGISVESTQILVSFDPQGELGEEDGLDEIGFANAVEPSKSGDKYSSEITAPSEGVMFLRIYATDGSKNYWSDELVVQVEE